MSKYEFNFSNNPIKDWNSDQNWVLLDATAKGYFTQLVLTSSQTKPYGHFPNDEKKLKRMLGLPAKVFNKEDYDNYIGNQNETAKTLKKYFDANGNRFNLSVGMLESFEALMNEDKSKITEQELFCNYDLWLNYLWENKWKPSLFSELIVEIDAELTIHFPELCDKIGDYFIPIAYALGSVNNNANFFSENKKTIKTKEKVKSKEKTLPVVESEDLYFEISDDIEIKESGLTFLDFSINNVFTFKKVYKAFSIPLTEKEKHTIWDLGISLLADSNNKNSVKKAQAQMAKAMKDFGKEATVLAITKMSLTKDAKLNPTAYFFKLLNLEKENTEKVEADKNKNLGINNTLVCL